MSIELLFQYALAAAAQEDDHRNQRLGPIHLLKYAYLGDLAYAQKNQGQTFSGAQWKFHHFGPWSVEAWQKIPAAADAIGALKQEFPSQYREDNVRWQLRKQGEPDELVKGVPLVAALAIRRAIREFGSDTTSLLHFVYKTPPMLRAAPGEMLSFMPVEDPKRDEVSESIPTPSPVPTLSKTKLKNLKALVRSKLELPPPRRMVEPDPPPRYDETFIRGVEWLDRLAGEPIDAAEGRLRFADSIWKSRARSESELP